MKKYKEDADLADLMSDSSRSGEVSEEAIKGFEDNED